MYIECFGACILQQVVAKWIFTRLFVGEVDTFVGLESRGLPMPWQVTITVSMTRISFQCWAVGEGR